MILITTAGKVGSAAARLIAQRGVPVRVLVRYPEKVAEKVAPLAQAGVEIFPGDLDSPETIDQAMRGVSTVILVTQPVLSQELSVIDSAQKAGVEHIVKITQFLVHLRAHQALLREVRAKLANPDLPPPASTMVQIGALTREGALYEVEAVAVLPPK